MAVLASAQTADVPSGVQQEETSFPTEPSDIPSGLPPNDVLWKQAVEAYAQANYQEAIDVYKSIYNRGFESASLYYNIGNCAFKMLQYAEAVLWFERAKLLEPENSDILYNLELANRFILDKIEQLPEFFLQTWVRSVRNLFSANQWAWCTLLLFAGALSLLLLFFFGRSRSIRRWAFYLSLFVALLALGAFSFGWSHKREMEQREFAIVFAPVASVKSAPDRQGKDLFIIHEGTKVRIMERVGAYGRIELADGRQGWIEIELAERI